MAQEPQWNKLCRKCQNSTSDPPSWPGTTWGSQGFGFHDINGLLQSAKEGCNLCNLIVAEFPGSRIPILERELKLEPQHCSRQLQVTSYDGPAIGRNAYLHSCFNLWHKKLRRNNGPSIICLVPIMIHDMRGTRVRRGALNTGLHVISEMIKAWIEDCVDNHPDCATAVQMTGRLPTRLLQIEKSGKSFKVKLCLSSALSPSTSYATLSHVWGSGSPMKLVNKNVLQCQQDIPIASLPQTFADAIQLTNALGLSYLWIDSLCIIQDSTLDWEVESTTMCDVYRGSTINIAASASVDCNGGLFRQRNPFLVTSCMMEVSHKQKEAGAREGEPYALLCEIACDGDPLVDEPLSRRAWAVQERILAPRTVYFTAQKIYFVCREKRLSDIDPCGFYEVSRLNHSLANTWNINRPTLGTSASELYIRLKNWQRVVQQYTHGQLSYESDKLVAIAGLAKHMQGKWLGPTITYSGGLWSFDLIDGLTWRKNKTLKSLARPKAYRAPSWSWASVEGEVEWWPDLESWPDVAYRASIVEARTSPTSNPFGSVHGGYIQIRGHLCTVNDKVSQFYPVWDVVSVDGRDGREHIIAASNELMIFTLLIDSRTPRSRSCLTSGLLLEYTGDKKGQYKRIGSFRAFGSHLLHTSRSFRPADHLFMGVNADNEYTVEII